MQHITTLQRLLVLMVCLSIFSLSFTSALTASIGNARAVIYPELKSFGTTDIDRTIKVLNTNNVSVNVSLFPSAEFKDLVTIQDGSFILAPQEQKNAHYVVHLKDAGDYEGKINVVFTEAGKKESGLVLSSTLVIFATKSGGLSNSENSGNSGLSMLIILLSITGILMIILISILFFKHNKKKKRTRGEIA